MGAQLREQRVPQMRPRASRPAPAVSAAWPARARTRDRWHATCTPPRRCSCNGRHQRRRAVHPAPNLDRASTNPMRERPRQAIIPSARPLERAAPPRWRSLVRTGAVGAAVPPTGSVVAAARAGVERSWRGDSLAWNWLADVALSAGLPTPWAGPTSAPRTRRWVHPGGLLPGQTASHTRYGARARSRGGCGVRP